MSIEGGIQDAETMIKYVVIDSLQLYLPSQGSLHSFCIKGIQLDGIIYKQSPSGEVFAFLLGDDNRKSLIFRHFC